MRASETGMGSREELSLVSLRKRRKASVLRRMWGSGEENEVAQVTGANSCGLWGGGGWKQGSRVTIRTTGGGTGLVGKQEVCY